MFKSTDDSFTTVVRGTKKIEVYVDPVLAQSTLYQFFLNRRRSIAYAIDLAHSLGLPYWEIFSISKKSILYHQTMQKWCLVMSGGARKKSELLVLEPQQWELVQGYLSRQKLPTKMEAMKLIAAAIEIFALHWDLEDTKQVVGFKIEETETLNGGK